MSSWNTHNSFWDLRGPCSVGKTCRDWFKHLKNSDFNVENKKRSDAPKNFEDEEMEALLDEGSSQMLGELLELLGTDRITVSKRLKALRMIQKHKNWVPNGCLFTYEQLTGDEKWIHYDNPQHRKSWGKPSHASTSSSKPNIHSFKLLFYTWWDQLSVVYYELLKPNEAITRDRYRLQLVRLSRTLRGPFYHFRQNRNRTLYIDLEKTANVRYIELSTHIVLYY